MTAAVTRLDGPAPEREVARDMVRKALPAAPVFLIAAAIGWGLDGALSSAYALALVCANFLVAAALMAWSARISLSLMMAVVLGGYIARLGLLVAAVVPLRNAGWMELTPLAVTLGVAHLGLLLWELRAVSASLAFPGLKPKDKD